MTWRTTSSRPNFCCPPSKSRLPSGTSTASPGASTHSSTQVHQPLSHLPAAVAAAGRSPHPEGYGGEVGEAGGDLGGAGGEEEAQQLAGHPAVARADGSRKAGNNGAFCFGDPVVGLEGAADDGGVGAELPLLPHEDQRGGEQFRRLLPGYQTRVTSSPAT